MSKPLAMSKLLAECSELVLEPSDPRPVVPSRCALVALGLE